tara:strand:+ start:3755 stop:4348 length:594 start_codon:yes stop_codon:yes gene_type:complete
MAKKISHYRNYQNRRKIKPLNIMPGMILEFNYSSTTAFDKKPLVLILHRPREYNVIDGLNLNYLTTNELGQVIRQINKVSKVVWTEVGDSWFKRFQIKGDMSAKGVPADKLYEGIIKARILPKFDCYRTYKTQQIRNLQVVDLDFKASAQVPTLNEHVYTQDKTGTDEPQKQEQEKKEKKRTSKNVNMQGDKRRYEN